MNSVFSLLDGPFIISGLTHLKELFSDSGSLTALDVAIVICIVLVGIASYTLSKKEKEAEKLQSNRCIAEAYRREAEAEIVQYVEDMSTLMDAARWPKTIPIEAKWLPSLDDYDTTFHRGLTLSR